MKKSDATNELAHCTQLAKCFKAMATSHDSCLKSGGDDHHKDMRDACNAAAASFVTRGEYCLKAAKAPDEFGDDGLESDEETHSHERGPRGKKILSDTERIDALRKTESEIFPKVHGVLPDVPAGLQLIGRAGGATPPTNLEKVASEFQHLFTE